MTVFGNSNSQVAEYFPELIPGWHWAIGPQFWEDVRNGISFKAGNAEASKNTIEVVIIVFTTATPEDASGLARIIVSGEFLGYGARVQRTGFLGGESWELFGPSSIEGANCWAVLWRRNSVVGLAVAPETARNDAYAWVDAMDTLFPKAALPIPWDKVILYGSLGLIGLGLVWMVARS